MLKRSHSVAHGFLSWVFASVFSRTCVAVLAIRCMAGLQLSTAVAQLSTAGHSCLLLSTVVYYQAKLSTA